MVNAMLLLDLQYNYNMTLNEREREKEREISNQYVYFEYILTLQNYPESMT